MVASAIVYVYMPRNGVRPMLSNQSYSREAGLASSGKGAYNMVAADYAVAPAPSLYNAPVYNQVTTPDRMVIRSGDVAALVKDVRVAITNVSEFAVKEGGYVVSSYVSKSEDKPYGTLSMRVPAVKFDAAFNLIRGLGDVQSENVNGQDITEEYIDLEAQMKNLRATETQLLQLMQRSGSIGDILNVQRELTNVRSQIERLEGRMKYLKESVAMSTISVHFSTDPDNLPVLNDDGKTWRPLAVFKQAVRSLVSAFIGVGNFLIYFVVLIPVWLVMALVIWVGYKVYLHFKNRS